MSLHLFLFVAVFVVDFIVDLNLPACLSLSLSHSGVCTMHRLMLSRATVCLCASVNVAVFVVKLVTQL